MNLFSTWTTRGFGALKNGGRAFALGSIFILTTVIALPRASEARIVYTYLNETCTTPVPGSCFVGINLNGARTDDFYLQSAVSYVNCPKHGGRYLRSFVRITPVASPGVVEENGFAAALNAGRRIGTGQAFGGELYLGISIEPHGCQINSTDGDWLGTGNHYLGLTINPHNDIHYGWALLSATCGTSCVNGLTMNLIGVAYETTVGKPIIAGQTMDLNEMARPQLQRFK